MHNQKNHQTNNVTDWQNNYKNFKERGAYLLNSNKMNDCQFLVGTTPNQKLISAHKVILAMASPVFEAMFYSNILQHDDPIKVPDAHPGAFKVMLDYIYADKISLPTNESHTYNDCFYLAKKYSLRHYVDQITEDFNNQLNMDNACMVYEFAQMFDNNKLKRASMAIIQCNMKQVLRGSHIIDVQYNTLVDILGQDKMNIDSELQLFDAVMRYKRHSSRLDMDVKEALQKIRFLTLLPSEIANVIAKSKVLKQDEVQAILMRIIDPSNHEYQLPAGFSMLRKRRIYAPPVPILKTNRMNIPPHKPKKEHFSPKPFVGLCFVGLGIYFSTQPGFVWKLKAAGFICGATILIMMD